MIRQPLKRLVQQAQQHRSEPGCNFFDKPTSVCYLSKSAARSGSDSAARMALEPWKVLDVLRSVNRQTLNGSTWSYQRKLCSLV